MIRSSNWALSRQDSTSGSRRFQSANGSTRVPSLGATSISRLAARFFTASRTVERLTPYSWQSSASIGRESPGPNSPETIRVPMIRATWALMVPMVESLSNILLFPGASAEEAEEARSKRVCSATPFRASARPARHRT